MSYLDRIKTEKNTKTATTYTDKTDRCPFVSNVSDSSERILDKIDVQRVIQQACSGLSISSEQFLALTNADDRDLIVSGEFDAIFLRGYAISFANGIESGRIKFHPASQTLLKHN